VVSLFRGFTVVAAAIVMLGSASVLLGWAFNQRLLERLALGWLPVRPLGAVGFFFAGAALFLLRDEKAVATGRRFLGLACAGELHERALNALRLEKDLRQAVARGEFFFHYQPIVRLANGRVSGLEALLRWQHPERGLLLPGEFMEWTSWRRG
jgi:hypothetical protein